MYEVNSLKVGFVSNIGIDFEYPHHGEHRYMRRVLDTMSPYAECEFIEREQPGKWDVLVFFDGNAYPPNTNKAIMAWADKSCKQKWIAAWGKTGFGGYVLDNALYWHARALRRILANEYVKNGILWYPPLQPIEIEQKNYVLYSPGFYDLENIGVLEIAQRLYDELGLEMVVTRLTKYLDFPLHDTDVEKVKYIIDKVNNYPNPPHLYSEMHYTGFQKLLAKSKVVIALHRGPSMIPMEAFVHGTPVITYYRQEEYLEPDYGVQVNRWKFGYQEQNNEIFNAVKQIVDDKIDLTETIKRMRFLSNPIRQAFKIEQQLKKVF